MNDTNIKELVELAVSVDKAAQVRKYGSFFARNPGLGRMVRCAFCRVRRREKEKCCNAAYVTKPYENNKGATVAPKPPSDSGASLFAKKRRNPRLTRKNPPFFLIHQLLVEIESDRRPDLENVPTQHLAAYVEKLITDRNKTTAKKRRTIQKESRKGNRK